MAKVLFWTAAAVAAYVYAGYPILLAAWSRIRPRSTKKSFAGLPGVSIVLAARNEEAHLGRRLQNLLALDYPADRRQIIVVSDGSTDRTASVAAAFGPTVEVVRQPANGKASALNAGVARARHEILVFADARQRFANDAVRQLAANFADDRVGAVSGELVLDAEQVSGAAIESIGEGVGLYWRYEKWLRRGESLIASTLGVTGAVYAMRRSCWQPLPPGTILDDVLAPMRAVLGGLRVIFDGSAVAYDRAADTQAESRRKVRTLAGNYQLLWLEPRLLLPIVNPVWVQFVSHKLGRLLVPYALLVCLVASAMLAGTSVIYAVAFAGQLVLGLLAVYGAVLDARSRREDETAVAERRTVKGAVNA